jgi:four helix bundle protein
MSEQGGWQSIEDFGMFGETERLADEIWKVVMAWNSLAQDTIGKQLIRAADSVGANLVEGDGRYHHKEKLNFYYIARASTKETRYGIRRAQSRCLLASEQAESFLNRLESVSRWTNTLITQRRRWIAELREESEDYIV